MAPDCISGFSLVSTAKRIQAYEIEKCFSVLTVMLSRPDVVRPFFSSFGVKTSDKKEFLKRTKKPMTLRIVQSKVHLGHYLTAEEFATDVRLIITNAYRFLSKKSYRVKIVQKFAHVFEEAYAKFGVEPVSYFVMPQDFKPFGEDPVAHQDPSEVKPAFVPVYEDISDDETGTAAPLTPISESSKDKPASVASSQPVSFCNVDGGSICGT